MLLHESPLCLIFFIEQLFFMFKQMWSIGSFGRRALGAQKKHLIEMVLLSTHNICFG